MRAWLATGALVLAASLAPISARIMPTRMDPWRGTVSFHDTREAQLQAQVDGYTRTGAFPKVARSLEAKTREASAFLDREMAKAEQRGVGASVAIVYKDQVILSKGYGLRKGDEASSAVDSSSIFQIGSVSKTFVAIGLAILVEEGKLAWTDPVKQHLPSFALFDAYAEKFATIGDLCAMNSGLDEQPDLGILFGLYPTDEDLVRALAFMEPAHSLRGGHEYSNSNFAILGQVIHAVTGQPWDEFLRVRVWEPLGMTRTFASAFDAQSDDNVAYGHFLCGGKEFGPYSLVDDPEAQLVAGGQGKKIAAGSVLSSSDDLATLLRLILNKGSVDGVAILNSTSTVAEMVTGKYPVNKEMCDEFALEGHQFNPDGDTLASGYGFDYVGHAQWGHAYFDKSGDTAVHVTRTGFAPDADLGVVVVSNTQTPEGHLSYPLDHIRSYLMGIFLDVPTEILDFTYRQWRLNDQLEPIMDGIPSCGLRFWDNPTYIPLTEDEQVELEGRFTAQSSPEFFTSLQVRRDAGGKLVLEYGVLSAPLELVSHVDNTTRAFAWTYAPLPLLFYVSRNDRGVFDMDFGVIFEQQ